MKKVVILSYLTFLFGTYLIAQNTGKGFGYQAVARTKDGQVRAKENVDVQFSLLAGVQTITPLYQETHLATTDEFGVFSMTIGKGSKSGGSIATFKDIDFASAEFWLKVEIKDNGSWLEISKTVLPSVPYAEIAGNAMPAPTGCIIAYGGAKAKIPAGWLLCDGTQLSRTQYSNLYNIIGTAWGTGNGSTTFHLPNLRGVFLRGVSDGRYDDDSNNRPSMYSGGNTNNNVGSFQGESTRSHIHTGTTSTNGSHTHEVYTRKGSGRTTLNVDKLEQGDFTESFTTSASGNHAHSFTTSSTGGNETRPDNCYVYYIIKL